jgi:hypothetical protein
MPPFFPKKAALTDAARRTGMPDEAPGKLEFLVPLRRLHHVRKTKTLQLG